MKRQRYHKIPKCEKCVCTAEQMIAYNIAWRLNLTYGDEFRAQLPNVSRIAADEAVFKLRDIGIANYKSAYDYSPKYDIDSIFGALTAGLAAYLKKPFIATNYEDIGRAFPAHYLEEV